MVHEQAHAALLSGESGGMQKWSNFRWDEQEDGLCRFIVEMYAGWYTATVSVDTSHQQLQNFLDDVAQMLNLKHNSANFLNENGNFEIRLTLGRRGNVRAEGVMIKSMSEDSRLEYEYETDLASLDRFHRELTALLAF